MMALMKSLCFSFIILASFATLFSVADARRFNVGGSTGWVLSPRESYNSWAERNRFEVNDTLYFKYAKGSDSVLQVTKADYHSCNAGSPLKKFDNGETEVTLNRSGPFYFISGNKDHCLKEQRLIVVVLAIRHPISPAKPPSTTQPPKAHSPVSPVAPAKAPSTAQPPKAHSPVSPVAPAKAPSTAQSPKAHSSVSPPAKAPSTTQPPKSHSPVSPAPSTANPPKAHSPVSPTSPAKAPAKVQPPKANSPVSPTTPANAPSTTPAPENSPPSSPTPSQSTPADNINAPAASPKNAASDVAVTSVMATVLSVAFTVVMFA